MDINNHPSRKYARAAEVAAIFGVARNTVMEWSKRGIITSYRIGHSTFYDLHEIDVVLCKNRYVGGKRRPAALLDSKYF